MDIIIHVWVELNTGDASCLRNENSHEKRSEFKERQEDQRVKNWCLVPQISLIYVHPSKYPLNRLLRIQRVMSRVCIYVRMGKIWTLLFHEFKALGPCSCSCSCLWLAACLPAANRSIGRSVGPRSLCRTSFSIVVRSSLTSRLPGLQ